jgi:hypothetical protein
MGLPQLEVNLQFGFLVTLVLLLLLLSPRFGILAASVSVLIRVVMWYILSSLPALDRVTGLGFRTIAQAPLPSLAATPLMAPGILDAKALTTAPTGLAFLVFLIILGGFL